MRIFLTGGTGFLGAHFLQQALSDGHEVIALRRAGSSPRIPITGSVEWIDSELHQVPMELLRGCDAFVHLAAQGVSPQKTDWTTAFEVNVAHSIALVEKALSAGISRILCCGSCMEYGSEAEKFEQIPASAPLNPSGPYASSKAAFTLALTARAKETKSIISLLRPFHFYGEGQHQVNLWPSLRSAALSGQDFPMTAGEQMRDFSPVEDVAQAFLHELQRTDQESGRIHIANVGSGVAISLADFAKSWWSNWNASGKLLLGVLPYREHEVMRFIPKLS